LKPSVLKTEDGTVDVASTTMYPESSPLLRVLESDDDVASTTTMYPASSPLLRVVGRTARRRGGSSLLFDWSSVQVRY